MKPYLEGREEALNRVVTPPPYNVQHEHKLHHQRKRKDKKVATGQLLDVINDLRSSTVSYHKRQLQKIRENFWENSR